MKYKKYDKIRVAVYIRIGGTGDNILSLATQKAHFIETISQSQEWELIEIYADVGAKSLKQANLGWLMADCRAGRIDSLLSEKA